VRDEVKEPGERSVEFGLAEAVQASWAVVALLDQAGCAKDREVVAAGRVADGNLDGAAGIGPVWLSSEFADDRAAYGVLQCFERGLQGHVSGMDVGQASSACCLTGPVAGVR
jgi:hypothetical protein